MRVSALEAKLDLTRAEVAEHEQRLKEICDPKPLPDILLTLGCQLEEAAEHLPEGAESPASSVSTEAPLLPESPRTLQDVELHKAGTPEEVAEWGAGRRLLGDTCVGTAAFPQLVATDLFLAHQRLAIAAAREKLRQFEATQFGSLPRRAVVRRQSAPDRAEAISRARPGPMDAKVCTQATQQVRPLWRY